MPPVPARRSAVLSLPDQFLFLEYTFDTNFVLHDNRVVRNVTVTLDEAVARWARVKAAQEGTSVSRLLGSMLEEQMEREEAYETAMRAFLARGPRDLSGGSPYPSRAERHAR